jgi:5-carboxymethyl-2-hydroxymuconate isomerase
MPHLIVAYSSNLEPAVDMAALLRVVHAAALATGVFPIGGLRTRAERHEHYVIADGHADNGFIHVQARIGTGRTPEVRQTAAAQIFAAVTGATAGVFASRPLGITLEMVEIDPVGSLKHNNLHEIVARRQNSATASPG